MQEERRQESIRYRKHLEAQLAIEKEEANELDHMYAEEQERAWAKRQAQWDREALARKRLMEEVDRSRKEQVQRASVRGAPTLLCEHSQH